MKRLVHLETKVQHELVVMDETGAIERKVIEDVRTIVPADWPEYSGKTFPRQLAQAERELNEVAKPNRAERRRKARTAPKGAKAKPADAS